MATVPIDGDMCGAPDAGFGSLWIPTGDPAAIHRVALGSRTLVASIAVALPAEGEFTIGAGESGVWAIVHRPDGARRLARLDPDTERIGDLFDVAAGAVSVRVGHGSVWMACPGDDEVLRVDPATGAVIRAFTTGRRPRFLVVGPEGVWVVNQFSGSVTHIDPVSDEVVATIPVDDGPLRGGDVALGAGSVWVRGTSEMVTRIDPESHRGRSPLWRAHRRERECRGARRAALDFVRRRGDALPDRLGSVSVRTGSSAASRAAFALLSRPNCQPTVPR